MVFEDTNPLFVLKLNSGVFYSSWEDYLNNLLIHNYFFPHLAYKLLGFLEEGNQLFAAVKQPFVRSNETTNLANVQEFLEANGFLRKREYDYFHPNLGIILEDLHDENVLTQDGTLQFIDSVFYLMPSFFDC